MAKDLDKNSISMELWKLINDAKEKILLVSTFKMHSQIHEQIMMKGRDGTLSEITLIYGKTDFKKDDLEWMKKMQNLSVYEKCILHVKYYLNEERAIICSMNLCDYSKLKNIETGILITRGEDIDTYNQLLIAINEIKLNTTRKTIDDF